MNKKNVLATLILACIATAPAVAQEVLTGMFRMTLTPTEVVGAQMAQAINDTVPADEQLRWQMYVPESYNPARPPGVFIFLDPKGYVGRSPHFK